MRTKRTRRARRISRMLQRIKPGNLRDLWLKNTLAKLIHEDKSTP